MKTREELIEEARMFLGALSVNEVCDIEPVEVADFALQVQAEAIADERRRVLEAVERVKFHQAFDATDEWLQGYKACLSALRKEIQEEA